MFPACAGVILFEGVGGEGLMDVPRVCGGDPEIGIS